MIRLNQTEAQLLSLVTAQNGATCVISYSDKSSPSYLGNTQVTSIITATTTTICGTPAASTIRDIDHISIRNTYAGSHAITLQLSSSAVLYPLITVTLSQGDTLEYTHARGFKVIDSNGFEKTAVLSFMTSAQLAGLISDETGSGSLVFATSPTLVTPVLGVATATSINKVTITTPATGATLTIADGKTLTVNGNTTLNTGISDTATAVALTLSGSGANSVTIVNSATNPTIGTSAGALKLGAAGALVPLIIESNAGGTPALGSTLGLAITGNFSSGPGDTAFFNTYHTATSSFDFRQMTASGTSASILAMAPVASGTGGLVVVQGSASINVRITPTVNNLIIGTGAALATTATEGHMMIPTCAGAPTGVPVGNGAGKLAVIYDTTNNFLYVYNGGWKKSTVYA